MRTDERRGVLVSGARLAAAAALGALAATFGLRRQTKLTNGDGYCDRAGRFRDLVGVDADQWASRDGVFTGDFNQL